MPLKQRNQTHQIQDGHAASKYKEFYSDSIHLIQESSKHVRERIRDILFCHRTAF